MLLSHFPPLPVLKLNNKLYMNISLREFTRKESDDHNVDVHL